MASGKKSFVLYCDLQEVVKQLSDKKAGELFKHILSYVNDEDPKSDDPIINLAFTPVKLSLKRDLKKYEKIVDRNRKNGAKGGRPKHKNKPTGLSGNPKKPKKADSDSDSDSDNVNEKNIYRAFDHLSISQGEYDALKTLWTKPQIDKILDAVENYTGNKKYKSLYLTARQWLHREHPPQNKETEAERQAREIEKFNKGTW